MVGAGRDDGGKRRRRRRQRLGLGPERRGQRLGRVEAVAQGQKIARAAAADRQALQGALDVGRAAQRLAHALAHGRALDEELHQVEAALDLGAVGQGSGDPLGQKARAGAGQGAVDGGEKAAVAPAVEPAHQLEVAARGGIDLHRAVGAHAVRRRERGELAGLRELDVVEQRAAGRDLGAREGAEAVERCDLEGRLQALAGIVAVEARRGQRRQHGIPLFQRGLHRLARQQPVGHQKLARRQPRQGGGELARLQGLGGEVGGREIEPGQRQLALRLGDGGEVIVAARIEQRVFGQACPA